MSYFIQVNLLALAILLLIYINLYSRFTFITGSTLAYTYMLYVNAIIIALNILIVILNGNTNRVAVVLLPPVAVVYFIMNPVFAFLWFNYIDLYIHNSFTRFNKSFVITIVPVIICVIFAFFSLFGNSLFVIDSNNNYHRGRFYHVVLIVCTVYALAAIVKLIQNRSQIRREELFPLLFFPLPAIIGSILNILFQNFIILWSLTTLSLLMVFIFIQSKTMLGDHLTGLYNKREFDNRFNDLSKRKNCKHSLGAIYMDLDGFKKINDQYGHDMGDQVLIDMGKLLTSSFKTSDFIARTGGDEFIATFNVNAKIELIERINILNNNVEQFNAMKKYPFAIELSYGLDIYHQESGQSMTSFFNKLDHQMYLNKMAKHSDVGNNDCFAAF